MKCIKFKYACFCVLNIKNYLGLITPFAEENQDVIFLVKSICFEYPKSKFILPMYVEVLWSNLVAVLLRVLCG